MSKANLISCSDCGGFDVEWMHRCDKHKADYCRGCSCPGCDEDQWDDYEEDGPMDLEDQLDAALDAECRHCDGTGYRMTHPAGVRERCFACKPTAK